MREKSRVLVVYGYHPYEKFALDVGMDLEQQSQGPGVKVVPYTGKHDFPSRVDERYQKPSFPNFWKFARGFSPSYVVDLHSGFATSAGDRQRGPVTEVSFYTRMHADSIDPSFRERMKKFVYEQNHHTSLHICPRFQYVPPSISWLPIEFMANRISKHAAREFVIGLIRVL